MATTFLPTMHLDERAGRGGGLERKEGGRGTALKGDGGAVDLQGVLCILKLHPFSACFSSLDFACFRFINADTCAPLYPKAL